MQANIRICNMDLYLCIVPIFQIRLDGWWYNPLHPLQFCGLNLGGLCNLIHSPYMAQKDKCRKYHPAGATDFVWRRYLDVLYIQSSLAALPLVAYSHAEGTSSHFTTC